MDQSLAKLAQAEDAHPEESVTMTPTTTGTMGGELYRLSAPSRIGEKLMQGEQPSDEEMQNAIDASFLMGMPIMKMGQLGAEKALAKLEPGARRTIRENLRYLLRAANRVSEKGPQNPKVRAEWIREAAGLKTNLGVRMRDLEGELRNFAGMHAEHPSAEYDEALKAWQKAKRMVKGLQVGAEYEFLDRPIESATRGPAPGRIPMNLIPGVDK